jgi:hypothetical protein
VKRRNRICLRAACWKKVNFPPSQCSSRGAAARAPPPAAATQNQLRNRANFHPLISAPRNSLLSSNAHTLAGLKKKVSAPTGLAPKLPPSHYLTLLFSFHPASVRLCLEYKSFISAAASCIFIGLGHSSRHPHSHPRTLLVVFFLFPGGVRVMRYLVSADGLHKQGAACAPLPTTSHGIPNPIAAFRLFSCAGE